MWGGRKCQSNFGEYFFNKYTDGKLSPEIENKEKHLMQRFYYGNFTSTPICHLLRDQSLKEYSSTL